MKHLGIDFGEKRIGVAISDDSGRLAFPHSVLENGKNILTDVEKIIKSENVEKIIIGESKDFEGKDNKVMEEIRKFKKLLEEKFGLPVIFEPEFMTSSQAKILQGENALHDASAAAIILQSFLDKNKKSS